MDSISCLKMKMDKFSNGVYELNNCMHIRTNQKQYCKFTSSIHKHHSLKLIVFIQLSYFLNPIDRNFMYEWYVWIVVSLFLEINGIHFSREALWSFKVNRDATKPCVYREPCRYAYLSQHTKKCDQMPISFFYPKDIFLFLLQTINSLTSRLTISNNSFSFSSKGTYK